MSGEELQLALQVNYPARSVTTKLSTSTTFADLQKEAMKLLNISDKDVHGHDFRAVSLGNDVISLGKKGDKETLGEAGVKSKSLIFLACPAYLKPQRPKKNATKDEKKVEKKKDVYKGLSHKNVLKKIVEGNLKPNLEKIAYDYVDIYAEKIFVLPEFLKLDAKFVKIILKRDTLNIKEGSLFAAIVAWGKAQTGKEKPTTDELKTVLTDMLTLIRFPCMTMGDVAAKVTTSGLLTSKEILEIYTYLGTKEDDRAKLKIAWNTKARVGRRAPNFFAWDPVNKGTAIIIADDKITVSSSGSSWMSVFGDVELSDGQHEWEIVMEQIDTSNSYNVAIGVLPTSVSGYASLSNLVGYSGNSGWSFVTGNGQKCNNSYPASYGSAATAGTVVRVKLDLDAHTLEFFVNDTSNGVAFTNVYGPVRPAVSFINSQKISLRFPQK